MLLKDPVGKGLYCLFLSTFNTSEIGPTWIMWVHFGMTLLSILYIIIAVWQKCKHNKVENAKPPEHQQELANLPQNAEIPPKVPTEKSAHQSKESLAELNRHPDNDNNPEKGDIKLSTSKLDFNPSSNLESARGQNSMTQLPKTALQTPDPLQPDSNRSKTGKPDKLDSNRSKPDKPTKPVKPDPLQPEQPESNRSQPDLQDKLGKVQTDLQDKPSRAPKPKKSSKPP